MFRDLPLNVCTLLPAVLPTFFLISFFPSFHTLLPFSFSFLLSLLFSLHFSFLLSFRLSLPSPLLYLILSFLLYILPSLLSIFFFSPALLPFLISFSFSLLSPLLSLPKEAPWWREGEAGGSWELSPEEDAQDGCCARPQRMPHAHLSKVRIFFKGTVSRDGFGF
jgi:hypothetical protein